MDRLQRSGCAGIRALHTPIHEFQVNGETDFREHHSADPLGAGSSLRHRRRFPRPERLSSTAHGPFGAEPDYNSGGAHYLVPADFATIYDVAPLYASGISSARSVAVVGESDVLPSDITSFRSRYGLPPNNPRMILYGSTDPGYNGAELEGNLDLE